MVLPITPLASSSASAFRHSMPGASTVKHNLLSDKYLLLSPTPNNLVSQLIMFLRLTVNTAPMLFTLLFSLKQWSFPLSRLPGLPSRGLSSSHSHIHFLKACTNCGNLHSCQLSSSFTRSALMPSSLSWVSVTYPLISFFLPMDSRVWIIIGDQFLMELINSCWVSLCDNW